MNTILLDPYAEHELPAGYERIDSEVAFLKRVPESSQSSLIQGTTLCMWARAYLPGRGVAFRELEAPSQLLRVLAPELTDEQAVEVSTHLDEATKADLHTLSLTALLQRLMPSALWEMRPSTQHAAEWLLWMTETKCDDLFKPLVRAQVRQWRQANDDWQLQQIYEINDAEDANRILIDWLGIGSGKTADMLGIFPLNLGEQLIQQVKQQWIGLLTTSHGIAAERLNQATIHPEVRKVGAATAVSYLEKQPQYLTQQLFERLQPHLGREQKTELNRILPPPMPTQMPTTPMEVLNWFKRSYLPARVWCSQHGTAAQQKQIRDSALQFSLWYLEFYPKALVGGSLAQHLSFKRTTAAAKQSELADITLLVVPDGLHADDADYLHDQIAQRTVRLKATKHLAFAPLPTVTEFCKPALFAGVEPKIMKEMLPLGDVLTDNDDPARYIENQNTGHFIIWRLREPDYTYHRSNSSDMLIEDVRGRLDTIATKIAKVVESIGDSYRLRIIVTSDHGRLLATSKRNLPVPNGMESHGRAAWGDAVVTWNANGFVQSEAIVYVSRERFNLDTDLAIVLTEDAFYTSDGKSGQERFPHGGLFPEEVVVPWIEYIRDAEQPKLRLHLSGEGQAGRNGSLTLRITSQAQLPFNVQRLHLSFNGKLLECPIDVEVSAYAEVTHTRQIQTWPTQDEASNCTGYAVVCWLNGLAFDIRIDAIEITSKQLYRSENILDDLDL